MRVDNELFRAKGDVKRTLLSDSSYYHNDASRISREL